MMRQAAMGMGMSQGQMQQSMMPPPEGGQSPQGGGGARMLVSDEVPEWALRLGMSRGDWVRFRGTLRADAASIPIEDVPAEYRELVKRYFQEIAKENMER